MRELNIEFQEQYKKLDKLCKDIFSSSEGVSAYIREMEDTPYKLQCAVNNWDTCYKELKHIRWMRNQLAHEISIDTDFCKQSDIIWINGFYNNILNGRDPLTLARKIYQTNMQQRVVSTKVSPQNKTIYTHNNKKPRAKLWTRIVTKIKSWFS